jgi:hypothetical protein
MIRQKHMPSAFRLRSWFPVAAGFGMLSCLFFMQACIVPLIPVLWVSPESFEFDAVTDTQYLTVENRGVPGSQLELEISASHPWILVDVPSPFRVTSTDSVRITVRVDISQLPVGLNEGVLHLRDAVRPSITRDIPVRVCLRDPQSTEDPCASLEGEGSGEGASEGEGQAPLETVELAPLKDATLYEDVRGASANGAGEFLIVGGFSPDRRRALLAFNVAEALPSGAVIRAAELVLTVTGLTSASLPITLHRVTTAWTEGTSNPPGDETAGTRPTDGAATWTLAHSTFPNRAWTRLGGDFIDAPSAIKTLSAVGEYTLGGDALLQDVLLWQEQPASNFGWIVLGSEIAGAAVKQLGSRENTAPSARPRLRLYYERPQAGARSAGREREFKSPQQLPSYFVKRPSR